MRNINSCMVMIMAFRPEWEIDLVNEEMKATIKLLRDGVINIKQAKAKAWELKKRGWWWQAMIIFKAIKKKEGGRGG